MHFLSAPVAVKMLSKRVLFILCFDGHFGRGFGPFGQHTSIQMVYKYINTHSTLFIDI